MENSESNTQEVSLGISDLQLLLHIVNVASERGAFKAGELSTVGAVYDRLNAFVSAQIPQDQAEETQGEENA